jgi:hypothetical protein
MAHDALHVSPDAGAADRTPPRAARSAALAPAGDGMNAALVPSPEAERAVGAAAAPTGPVENPFVSDAVATPVKSPNTRANPVIGLAEIPAHVRTAVDVRAARADRAARAENNAPPEGMPLDCTIDTSGKVYADRGAAVLGAFEMLFLSICNWIRQHALLTFTLKKKGNRPPVVSGPENGRHGVVYRIHCSREGKHVNKGENTKACVSKRCGCGFTLNLEECDTMICVNEKSTFLHNHAIDLSAEEVAASAKTRDKLSPELLKEAEQMKRLAPTMHIAHIANFLRAKEKERLGGVAPTWTNKDMYNIIQPGAEERFFDSANFVSELKAAEHDGACAAQEVPAPSPSFSLTQLILRARYCAPTLCRHLAQARSSRCTDAQRPTRSCAR